MNSGFTSNEDFRRRTIDRGPDSGSWLATCTYARESDGHVDSLTGPRRLGGSDQMPDSLTREGGCAIQDEILKPTQWAISLRAIYGAA